MHAQSTVRATESKLFRNSAPAAGITKMLLLDDDPEYGAIARQAAKANGIDLEVAGNAWDAQDDLESYSAIIVDLHLEEDSGLDCARFIESETRNVPVILISGKRLWEANPGRWPACIRRFVSKSSGLKAILTAALLATRSNAH